MYRQMFKRAVDIAGASSGLLLLSPVIAATALGVRLSMGSPVFFRQLRPGRAGKPFALVKFRSMRDASAADGPPLPDADRLTPFGQFIRRASLDELPQLWNVLKGDMSLVGPRPLLMEYLPLYSPEQARRHDVKPGITGLAQVSGRNAISWEQKLELDTNYVDRLSLLLDMKILALTVRKVMMREGINQDGQATAEKFRGTRA